MYFHAVHGKNIVLSNDSSQAKRTSGFCHGVTFSNNPLTPLQRVTFLVGSDLNSAANAAASGQQQVMGRQQRSKKPVWNGCLRIGLTTKNPSTFTTSELPEFAHPTLLNTEGFWVTLIKSSLLKSGNKISLVLDQSNSLQLAVNYVVKATLFGNNMIPSNNPATKLWLILDLYGATNIVQFLPSDETPYEIKARGLDAVNNFHSACMSGGSKSIYKTRLLIVGQEGVGKSTLRNSLVNFKNRRKDQFKKVDAFASFRVSVDNTKKTWNLKASRSEALEVPSEQRRQNKRHKSLSSSSNNLAGINNRNFYNSMHNLYQSYNENYVGLGNSLNANAGLLGASENERFRRESLQEARHRTMSTSYLNEEDDYDNDASFLNRDQLRTFRRQMNLSERLENHQETESTGEREPVQSSSAQEGADSSERANSAARFAPALLNDKSPESSSSSDADSDDSESEEYANLYSIEEYDDSIQLADCDPVELKKDPTGYYYKRIALNIYQELFTTKLIEKLWPPQSGGNTTSTSSSNSISQFNNFTESFFEKVCLVEFENSIYNGLKASKILYKFYEQVVQNQSKMLFSNARSAGPIQVNPLIRSETLTSMGENMQKPVKKILNKKLSLTLFDFAGQSFLYTTHQLFLSSRSIYLICFDLTKDLTELAHTNFEYAFEKNSELTNLDYLDFWMRSIHSHTALLPESATLANTNSFLSGGLAPTSNMQNSAQLDTALTTVQVDEHNSISFRYSAISPPIIIVGTNRNLLKQANKDEHIKRTFDRIREFVSTKVYAKHIVEPYFAIDSLAGSDLGGEGSKPKAAPGSGEGELLEEEETPGVERDTELQSVKEIEKLKRVIELVAINEPYMGEQLPLKWMNFEKSLEKLKNKGLFYASLSQVLEIAHEKDIKTQEELTTCLNFFHDLGVIIYYGNANDIFLRNTIILKPQKLVEIFKLVLSAKIPDSIVKYINNHSTNFGNMRGEFEEDPLTGRLVARRVSQNNPNTNSPTYRLAEMWQKFDVYGILNDQLLDILWENVLDQKPGLLGLMKKFDLICERNMISGNKSMYYNSGENLSREYLVPSRVTINYEDEIDDETTGNYYLRKKKQRNSSSDEDIEDLTEYKTRNSISRQRAQSNISIIEFFYDFGGFLPESLFHRILTRTARWTLLKAGANWQTAVKLFYRKARFYLDENHDFILEMAPLRYSRIRIQVVRISNGYSNGIYSPEPNACAKVRNFMETTLIELRNLWMKRLLFNACVQCACDKLCDLHQLPMCTHNECMHFLNLDECLTNNIVNCDFRRVKTLVYKSWFPVQNISLHKGPVLAAVKSYSDSNMFYDETSLPNWVKLVAKSLQVNHNAGAKDKENKEAQIVTVPNENDWLALARLLGYTKSKINYFMESENPALQLICDWIMSSDNTNLTIEFLLNYLEQIKRDDVIKIINNEREKETVNSSVFISYQWDSQDEVVKIKEHLEKAGFNCFMDIGQIGGGNLLYQKIDQAIRNSKVVIACITPKFVVSHLCNREMALADLLRKPIVPIMLSSTPWPPPGTMSLIFSQLVYIDMNGVGGHGGCGIHSDREQRNNEIVAMVSRFVNPSSYFLMNIDRIKDNEPQHTSKSKRKLLDSFRPSQLIRSSAQYYNQHNQGDAFIDDMNYDRMQSRFNPYPNFAAANPANGNGNMNAGSNLNPNPSPNQSTGNQQSSSEVPRCIICCIL